MNRREWIFGLIAAASLLAEEAWSPVFLTAEQNRNLVALGERIVPGSTAAMCNRVIDLILSIESRQNQSAFVGALAALTQSSAQLDAVLEAASKSQSPLYPQFQLIKEWMVDTYWSSEQGLRELGSTGRMAWEKFDTCERQAS